jgi:hypothetical protein
MTSDPDTTVDRAGRPVVLTPVTPGLWLVIGGGILAVLAPLFGFLIGSMIGSEDTDEVDPIFLCLMLGIIVGGAGVGLVLLGARRLLGHLRDTEAG